MGGKIRVAIAGVNGRFGRASLRDILADPDLELTGAFGRQGASYAGCDVGKLAGTENTGILVSNGFQDVLVRGKTDVVLDFTRADAAVEIARAAMRQGVRPVIGTSGIAVAQVEELSELSRETGTSGIIVPNFSVGAVLMMEFARQAAAFFDNVEIVEMHQPTKIDAPSGTAMYTTRLVDGAGKKFNEQLVKEHEILPGCRGGKTESGLRVHSLRLPGLISHQEVYFGAEGELFTIKHDTFTTKCFSKGILMAVKAVMGLNGFVVGLENLLVRQATKAQAGG